MTSFFFTFFDSSVGHVVFGETDPPAVRRVERVVLNALSKLNAALPPKFDIEQRFAGNA